MYRCRASACVSPLVCLDDTIAQMRLMQTAPQALSADLAAQVDTLLRTAFDLTGPYDYGPDRAEIVLPLDDGRVVGHAATYRRAISIGGETVTVGMIGGVAIDATQ